MEKRRYGGGTEVPSLSLSPPVGNQTTTSISRQKRNICIVPNKAKVSETSNAKNCFVNRNFSQKLQHFLLNYSYVLMTTNVMSGEV